MVWLILAVAAVLVVVVGLLSVGSAVNKTNQMPNQIVFDVHEAIEFCAQAIPSVVSSTLSYDELRRVLRFHLEWIQAYHWSPEHDSTGPIVFEEFDALDYVMERADVTRLEVERSHARAVIEAHTKYLQAMGAIHIEEETVVEADLADFPLLDSSKKNPSVEEGNND